MQMIGRVICLVWAEAEAPSLKSGENKTIKVHNKAAKQLKVQSVVEECSFSNNQSFL